MPLVTDTLFGIQDKVAIAIDRLRTFEPPEGYHLAFSGGKDSQTIYELSVMAGVRFDAHMSLTTVDPPELLAFVKANYPYPTVELHRPKESMWRLIRRKGTLPTMVMRFCCAALKESQGDGRTVMTGVRASESARRSRRSMIDAGPRGRRYLHPIIDWTEADVWQFHAERGLPHVCLYDEGWSRVGCIGCPMATHANRVRDFARWPGYRQAYLNTIQRVMIEKPDVTARPADTAEGMIKWWMREESPKQEGSESECYLLNLWS